MSAVITRAIFVLATSVAIHKSTIEGVWSYHLQLQAKARNTQANKGQIKLVAMRRGVAKSRAIQCGTWLLKIVSNPIFVNRATDMNGEWASRTLTLQWRNQDAWNEKCEARKEEQEEERGRSGRRRSWRWRSRHWRTLPGWFLRSSQWLFFIFPWPLLNDLQRNVISLSPAVSQQTNVRSIRLQLKGQRFRMLRRYINSLRYHIFWSP